MLHQCTIDEYYMLTVTPNDVSKTSTAFTNYIQTWGPGPK